MRKVLMRGGGASTEDGRGRRTSGPWNKTFLGRRKKNCSVRSLGLVWRGEGESLRPEEGRGGEVESSAQVSLGVWGKKRGKEHEIAKKYRVGREGKISENCFPPPRNRETTGGEEG